MRARVALAVLAAVAAAGDDQRRADLRSGEWERTNVALDALATEPAAVAVPLLTEALDLDDAFFRRRAAQTLAGFGKDAAAAVPALIQALYDEDRLVATLSAGALDAIGATEAVPYLLDVGRWYRIAPPGGIRNLRMEWTSPLAKWLGRGKVTDPACLDRLREGLAEVDPALRAACAFSIGHAGPHAGVLVPLLRQRLLEDDSFEVRGRAAYALGRLGAADEETIAALARAWTRRETFLRRQVAGALAALGEPAFPVLGDALAADDTRLRRWAAFGLGQCEALPASLVPALRAALATRDRTLRLLSVRALAKAGEHAAPAVADLVGLLDAGDDEMAIAVLEALGAIGPAAAPQTPLLLPLLREGALSGAATRALGALGSPEAVAALKERLDLGANDAADALAAAGDAGLVVLVAATSHEGVAVRRAAAGGLARARIFTPEVLEAMRRLASEDPDKGLRATAAAILASAPTRDDTGLEEVLARIRTWNGNDWSLVARLLQRAKPATLLAMLRDENVNVRRVAAIACTQAEWSAEDLPKARAELARALDDPTVKDDIARAVAGFGDPSALKPLLRVLAADKSTTRHEMLGKAIAAIDGVLPGLVEALDDPVVRAAAVEVIARIGPPAAEPARAKLAALVHNPDRSTSAGALWALATVGAVAEVRDALRSSEQDIRGRAIHAAAAGTPELRRALLEGTADDVEFRRKVAETFVYAKDVDGLLALARDPDPAIRARALQGLTASKAPAGVPALFAALPDPDPNVRATALACLSQSRPAPEDALPALERLLEREEEEAVLKSAALLARRLGGPARPLLERALTAKEKRLRLFAVAALESDLLVAKALADEDENVRAAAATGLAGKAEALDALLKALDDPSKRVSLAAAYSLAKLGEKAAPAARKFVERIAEGDDRLVGPLTQIGAPGAPFLVYLPPKQRATIEKVLRSIGPRAATPLIEMLDAEDPETRRKGAWGLGLLGRDAEAAVPALTKALGDDGRFVATQAAWALGEIGAGAASAIPELEKMSKDPKKGAAAAAALRKIKG